MDERILFVDDDQNLLSSIRRLLGRKYNLDTVDSGHLALRRLDEARYCVVISDLRMPYMDGLDLMKEVKKRQPDTSRIILTGHADLKVAMDAVNEGEVFRFLTKPLPPASMEKVIETGIRQYRLVSAERELLSKTLLGSVELLVDMMQHLYPPATSTGRLRSTVKETAFNLGLSEVWQYELAAMLCKVGIIKMPLSILNKLRGGDQLNRREETIFQEHLANGYRLLEKIPRMENIAEIVRRMYQPTLSLQSLTDPEDRNPGVLGAQLVNTAIRYEGLLTEGEAEEKALLKLRLEGKYDPVIIDAMPGASKSKRYNRSMGPQIPDTAMK